MPGMHARFGHPAAQLAAVKLWAIMMRKCSADFIAQTATRKFLGKIEEVVFSLTTSPVVRDRLVEVIGESVFQLKDTKHLKSYAATWKKLRSQLNLSAPIEGIKTSLDDPTLNPTSYRLPSSMREHPTCEQPNTKEEIVVPSNLSAPEMFQCLLEHGCTDVSSRINPNRQSATAVAGGSFGDIWMSELDDGTKVAIKCFRFHAIAEDQPKGLKRATREIYMWSKAKHPNVHELMGVIMFQGRLGMVSMWMENGSLHEYIRKNTSVDRYQLCVQVAAGVSYLHGICMVHGDIKALNILVSQDGVAKLSDFDHSILSNATLAFSATTNSGGGTLRWMAPELLASTEDENMLPAIRTTQTDVYALGMTML
ncbi:kinase-like protein [Ceratobasidium sp. AG-I]|nr:kinase-like protein [Ceratobasidium sp. AG-I]